MQMVMANLGSPTHSPLIYLVQVAQGFVQEFGPNTIYIEHCPRAGTCEGAGWPNIPSLRVYPPLRSASAYARGSEERANM